MAYNIYKHRIRVNNLTAVYARWQEEE